MKKIILFLAVSLLVGCSTELKYSMNNSKFLSPEAKGKLFSGDAGLSYQMTHKVVISEAFDPLIFNVPAVTRDVNQISIGGDVSIPLNLGLLEKLDFFTIDGKYGFKYQLIGEPEIKKEEGMKGAIAVAYGYDHPKTSQVTYTSSSSSVRIYETDMKVKSIEVSLLLGKRINPNNLFYSNLFHDRYTYDGRLSSTQFSPINAKGKSNNTGLLLGYELFLAGSDSVGIKFKLEGGIAQAKLDNYDKRTSGIAGSTFGLAW